MDDHLNHQNFVLRNSMSRSESLRWMVRNFSQPAKAQMMCFLSWNDISKFKTFSYKNNHMHLDDEKFFEQFHRFMFLTKFAMHNPNVWKLMNKFQIDLNRLNLEWLTHVHQTMIEQLDLNWSMYDQSHPFWSVVLKCKLSPELMLKYHKHVDLLKYFQMNREHWRPEFHSLLQEPSFACFAGLDWSPDLKHHLMKNASFLHNVVQILGVEKKKQCCFQWPTNEDHFKAESSPLPCFIDPPEEFYDKNNDAFGFEYYVVDDFLCKSKNDIFVPHELLRCVYSFLKSTLESHVFFFSDMLINEFPDVFWSIFFLKFKTFRRLSRSHWMALFMKCKTLGHISCVQGMKFVELLDPVLHNFQFERRSFKVKRRNCVQIVCNYSKKMKVTLSWPLFKSLNYYKIPTLPWSFEEMCAMCHEKLLEPRFDEPRMLNWLKLWFSSNASETNIEIVKSIDTEYEYKDDVFSEFAKWAVASMKQNDVEFENLNVNEKSDIVYFLSHPFHVRLSAWKRSLKNGKDKNLTRMFINTLSNDQWSDVALSLKDCFNEKKRRFFFVQGDKIPFKEFANVFHSIIGDLFVREI